VFNNPGSISIAPAGMEDTPASPYPSAIQLPAMIGAITDVNVILKNYTSEDANDPGILLQGPGGQALALLEGGPGAITNATITVDDSAAARVTQGAPLGSGSYGFKPTDFYAGDVYPAPGPGTSYGNPGPDGGGTATLASTFNGLDPNGAWKLFVVNFGSARGQIAGGWSLELGGAAINDNFTLGAARVKKSGRSATVSGTFPNPGTAAVSDATAVASGAKKGKKKGKKPKRLVVSQSVQIPSAGTFDLPVKPTGRAKSILARSGKVTLRVAVTYTVADGTASSQTISVKLKKKKRRG
jgi:hypothetical protein